MTQALKDTNEETAPPHLWWRPPVRRTPADRFCPYALGDWLAAAQRAGVPAVPGREISVFETADLKNAEWDGPHQDRLVRAWRRMDRNTPEGWMVRWDVCAGIFIKGHFGEKRTETLPPNERRKLVMDPRFHEALEEWPRPAMPVYARPWIEERMLFVDGHPVEYWVYVENSKVLGVSSYYYQRPLSGPMRMGEAQAAADRAESLIRRSGVRGPCDRPAPDEGMMNVRASGLADLAAGMRGKPKQEYRGPDPQ